MKLYKQRSFELQQKSFKLKQESFELDQMMKKIESIESSDQILAHRILVFPRKFWTW
jgi:hypothetical protein